MNKHGSNEDETLIATEQFYKDLDDQLPAVIPLESAEYLKSANRNLDRLCRICLNVKHNLVSIFGYEVKDSGALADIFTSITTIEIFPDDGLPSNICLYCKEQIVNCYNFKELCAKSYITLKTILKEDLVLAVKSEDDSEWPANSNLDSEIEIEFDAGNQETHLYENDLLSGDAHNELIDECQIELKKNLNLSVSLNDNKELQAAIKKYTCSICSKRFKKLQTLKLHLKLKHRPEEKPFSCSDCKETFILKRDLEIHSVLHAADGKWECIECHKVFTAKKQLKRHVSRHMGEKRFKCEVCDKAFTELYALGRHRRTHTGEALERKHACHLCNKTYVEASTLRAHLRRHTGERPCACAVCGRAFASPRLLRSHMRTHDDRKPHKCDYCDQRFRHESTRNTHHRTHTGEKPYVCSVCGKTFIQSSNLTLHMRTHSGEKPYSCTSCGHKFSSWSSLKTHERIHTGEKPYSCEICGKRFARRDLRSHMRRHTGEAPFACEVCHKPFTTRTRLRDHKRVHTGEKPFECETCDQKYSTKSQLLKHTKTHKTKKIEKNKLKESKIQLNDIVYEEPLIADNIEDCSGEVVNINPNEIVIEPDIPVEVTTKLELQKEDEELKTEIVLVDQDTEHSYQLSNINLINNSIHLQDNMVNLVTVNEGSVNTSQSTMSVECAHVKLYHFDQNLLQIHTSGSKLTFSKISSKIMADLE